MMILKAFRPSQAPTETNTRRIRGPQYVYSCTEAFVPKINKEHQTNRKSTRNHVISKKQKFYAKLELLFRNYLLLLLKEFDMKWFLSYLATGMWNNFYFKKSVMKVVLPLDLSVTCLEDDGQGQASYKNPHVERVRWKSTLNNKYHDKYIKKLAFREWAAFMFVRVVSQVSIHSI